MPVSVDSLITWMNGLPPVFMLLAMAAFAFGGLLAMFRFFGAAGVYSYLILAMIGANLQVLKVVQFGFFPDPVALGTVLFSSTFLATDVLAEFYGPKAARKSIFIGFAGFLLWTVLLLLTLGFAPLTPEIAAETGTDWALPMHGHMSALFTPMPTLFLAGMISYLISQLFDVWVFDRIRTRTQGRLLWLRNNVSTALSGLLDNTVFSLLAWIVLAEEPLPLGTVIVTYILGTYVLRLAVAMLDTPFMYLARRLARDTADVKPYVAADEAEAQPVNA